MAIESADDLIQSLFPADLPDVSDIRAAYGVQDTPTPTATTPAGGSPDENLTYAYNYFLRQGLKPHQAAAIVGNLAQESGGRTGAKGDKILPNGAYSYGLAQHNRERLHGGGNYVGLIPYAQQRGTDPSDLNTQLDYIMQELQGPERAAYEQLLQAKDLPSATMAFGRAYERPSEQYANYANRIAQARKYVGEAMPEEAVGQQAPANVYDLILPNGGSLRVPQGMSQQEAIAIAAKDHPELAQYLHPPKGDAVPGKTEHISSPGIGPLEQAKASLVGGAEELGASLLKGYAETGLPGAERAEEYSKAMAAEAEKTPERITKEDIDAAYKRDFLSGLATEAQAVGLQDIPHMIGRYGATLIPAGRALTVGKYLTEGLASFGDIQRRAEKEHIDVDTWKAGAGAAVSSFLANAGLPHVVANGVLGRAFGASSMKALKTAFDEGGVEAANKLLGSKLIDTFVGLGTATGAGFGVMAGTEAAQRAALGKELQTPEELGQELRTAAWMSPLAIPGAMKAKGQRGEYIDYLQQQKTLKDIAADIERSESKPTSRKTRPQDMPDQEYPDLTKREADLYRESLVQAEPPTGDERFKPPQQEPPTAEPPPGAEEPTIRGQQEAPPTPEPPPAATVTPLWPEEILGLKPAKDKRSLYQKLAAFDLADPATHPKIQDLLDKTTVEIPADRYEALTARMADIKPPEVPSAQQIPQAGPPVRGRRPQPIVREEGRDQAVSGEGVEPSGQRIETPEVKAPETPQVEVPPTVAVAPPPEAKAPEVTTPEVKAPEVTTPEVKAPEVKAPEIQPPPEIPAPEVKRGRPPKQPKPSTEIEAITTAEEPHPLSAKSAELAESLAKTHDAMRELTARRKVAEAARDPVQIRQISTNIQNVEGLIRRLQADKKKVDTQIKTDLAAEVEKKAAAAREEAARKVQEQGGYEMDLVDQEGAPLPPEKQTAPSAPPAPPAPKTVSPRKLRDIPDENDLIQKIASFMEANKAKQSRQPDVTEVPPKPAPTQEATAPKEPPEWVKNHERDLGGRAVYHDNDVGLVQGFSVLNGKPVFSGIKGGQRTRVDIEAFAGDLFTPEEKQRLVEAKRKWMDADAEAHAANPDGPFQGGKTFVASPGVPREIAEIARHWAQMLGLKDRIYLTTTDDAKTSSYAGPYASIPSQAIEPEGGSKRRLSNGDVVIAYKHGPKLSKNLEIIAHELGHALMDTGYKEASPEVKAKLDADFADWLVANKGKTAEALITSLRARAVGKTTTIAEGLSADSLPAYWKSRSEWFADQVSRWATTTEKPLGVVEQFFSRLANAMKRFFLANRQYLPTKNMHEWLDSLSETPTVEPSSALKAPIDSSLQEARTKVTGPTKKPDTEGLTKVRASEAQESAEAAKNIMKKVFKLATDSEVRNEAYTEIARKAVSRGAGLARHVSPLETYSDWWGIRSDQLRNQFDNLSHFLSNAQRLGTPDISEGGVMKINRNERLALANWFQRSDKLSVPQKDLFDIARILIGEQWAKESEAGRALAQRYQNYAKTLEDKANTSKGKERDKYRKLARGLKAKAKEATARFGTAPMEGLEKKVTPEQIKWAHDTLRTNSDAKDWIDQMHEINRKAVDFMVKTGMIDPETAKTWKARPYVALFKSLEDLNKENQENLQFFGGSAKSLQERKAIKGGTHAVNIPENMLRSWTQIYVSGYKNHVRKRAIRDMQLFGLTERTNAKDPMAVKIKRNGKEEYWRVPDQATLAALEMSPQVYGILASIGGAPADFAKSTLIKHPVYWTRSITREPLTANFTSRTGFVSPHQVIGHLFKMLAGRSDPKKLLEDRGIGGIQESQLKPENFSRAITKTSWYGKIRDFWNHVHSAFDTATRAAVMEAAKKEGAKYGLKGEKLDDFAAMKASEFANFATRGASQLVNDMGRMTPFFNAALNSLDNLYRNATGTNLNFREKKQARDMFRARAAGMAYLTAVYALIRSNDEDYLKASDADWTMNFLVPTGDGEYSQLPLAAGFETAVMFKVIPELLVRTYMGNLDSAEALSIAKDVTAERFLPPLVPMLIAMGGRAAFDYDLNLGRGIEGSGAKNLPPELRGFNASSIAKYVSEKFQDGGMGVSPTKIDSLMKGMFGGIYDMAISMADLYLASADPDQLFDKDMAQKYPILKGFYTSSQNVQKAPVFYEAVEAADQAVRAINEADTTGNVKALNKLLADKEFMAKHELAKPLRRYRDAVNQIRKEIRVLHNMKMPVEEKRARAADLTRLRHAYETEAAIWAQKYKKDAAKRVE